MRRKRESTLEQNPTSISTRPDNHKWVIVNMKVVNRYFKMKTYTDSAIIQRRQKRIWLCAAMKRTGKNENEKTSV
jgi:hypothetical protein